MSLFALAAIAVMVVAARRVRTTAIAIAFGLLLGGGVGNLLDRLLRAPSPLRGGVVDWLKPTMSSGSMNLADLAINMALVVIVVGVALEWLRVRSQRGEPDPESETIPPST